MTSASFSPAPSTPSAPSPTWDEDLVQRARYRVGEQWERARISVANEQHQIVGRMVARPGVEKLIGPGNLAMMQDNGRNSGRFMSARFRGFEPAVLAQTYPFFEWVMVNIPTFVTRSDEQLADPLSRAPSRGAVVAP